MTPTETVKFVRIVGQVWPSMKLGENTPDAWSLVFDDVSLDDALAAVRVLSKTRAAYVTPADIRRQVAITAGLIPTTTEAEGLQRAAEVASRRGEGAKSLDPITYAAYRAMGGPTAFTGDAPMSVIRPQWARVWADAVRQFDDRVLGGDIGAQIHERLALTAGATDPSILAATHAPALVSAPNRSADAEALIRAMSARLPKTGFEALHPRESRWRRVQRALTRKPEPNPHFTGFRHPDSEVS